MDKVKFAAVVLILVGIYAVVTRDVFQIISVGKFGISNSPETRGILLIIWGLIIYGIAFVGERMK